jgi:HlyD family secretion protein
MPNTPFPAGNPARLLARIVVPAVILSVAAAILAVAAIDAFREAPKARVTPVAVVRSLSAAPALEGGIQAAGWIEPAPFALEVRALREGVVGEVLALEGARVEKDELLATLVAADAEIGLREARAELRVAEADVSAREAVARAAEELLARAIEPERRLRIAENALSESTALAAVLDAEIAQATLLAREARDLFERRSELAAVGAAAEGDARRLGLQADALDARVRALEAERPARAARRRTAEAELAAAREAREALVSERGARDEAVAELAHARAQRDLKEAALAAAELALLRSEIRAPRAATVLTRSAVPGARAGGDGPPLFTLYDPSQLQVRCDIPLKEAARLAVGMRAEVRSEALPDARFAGAVVRIVPQGDLEKNTVQCKVLVEAPDAALRPDMLVRVRITTSDSGTRGGSEAVAVPREALRAVDDAAREADVLVAIPTGALARVERRRIALGAAREGGWIEVTGGLAAGDRVVLDASIEAGSRIDPVESLKGDAP